MDYPELIAWIDTELLHLHKARILLDAIANRRTKRPAVPVVKPKRTISKKHRTAIAAAQKARWAKKRAA